MSIKKFQDKNYNELLETLSSLKKEAFNLRFQKVYGQLTNTSQIRSIRKDIARVMTIINNKKQIQGKHYA